MKISKASVFATIAVLAMVLCSFVPVVNCSAVEVVSADETQADKQTYKYVSLGDSMSVGFGLTGYYPETGDNRNGFLMDVESTYPHKLTEYLKEELGDGYDVKHAQIGASSMRSIEIRALIDDTFTGRDDLPGDEFTQDFFSGGTFNAMCAAAAEAYPELAAEYSGFELLQQVYRTELADADLITYNSHYDFGYALSGKIMDIASGGPGIDTDFSLYYEKEYVEKAKEIEQYILNYLIDFLKEQGLDLESIVNILEKIARAAVYSVISYCANFDAFMEYIMAVNPDAKVIVIDTYNMFEDLSLKISGVTVSVAGFYQLLLDISNFYAAYSSPYALYAYHLTLDEQPVVMGNEFRSGINSEITDDAKAGLIYAMGLADRAALPSSVVMYDSLDQTGNLSLLMKYIFSSTVIDSSQIIGKDISALMKELGEKLSTAVGYVSQTGSSVIYNEEDGSCTVSLTGCDDVVFSKDDLSLLWLNLFSLSGAGVLCHPSPNGHTYIEGCIEEKLSKDDILSEGDRVYIKVGSSNGSADDGSSFDAGYILYSNAMVLVHGGINYVYLNWDEIRTFVDSEDYLATYQKIQGLYASWQTYYKDGGLDTDVEKLRLELVDIDANWSKIFGKYAELEFIMQLHTMLRNALDDWDSVKIIIGQAADILDQLFADAVEFLEPENLRTVLGDSISSILIRESLLNISLSWESFIYDIYQDITTSETYYAAVGAILKTITEYAGLCHEAKLVKAVESTCYTDGCIEHYECKICDSCFVMDESGRYTMVTEDDVIIHSGHKLTGHDATESTCKEQGHNLYYTCENCDIVLKADKETVTTVEAETLPLAEHNHTKTPAVTPTKTQPGCTEGEVCSSCGHVFIEPKEIPATGTDSTVVTTTTSTAEVFVQDSEEIKTLTVKFDGTSSGVKSAITIPESSVSALKGKTIQFSVNKSAKGDDMYDISMIVDDSTYKDNTCYISLPYDPSKGVPSVKWNDGGSGVDMEVVSTDSAAGLVTFKTTHNSTYQITYSPAPAEDNSTTVIIVAVVIIIALLVVAGAVIWKKKRGTA